MFSWKFSSNIVGLVAILFSMHLHAKNSIDDVLRKIVAINPSQLKDCAYKGDRICKRDLGLFYSYSFELPNGKTSLDIEKAKLWLSEVTSFPSARYALGEIYIQEADRIKQGESLLFSSCVENNKDACFVLYRMYEKEIDSKTECNGNTCNYAVYVIKKIIENESDDDLYMNGFGKKSVRYFNGKLARLLIKRKDPDAIPLLEKEVEADAPFASSLLAPLYETGELAAKNLTRAYMMYDLSGSGYADEKAKVAEQMTPAQVREAQEMSWRWQDDHRSYRAGYRGSDIGIHGKFEQQ